MIILFSTRHKRYRKAYLILLIKTWPTHSKTLVHHSVAFSVAVESNTRWRKIRTHWARLSGISEKTPFFWFKDFRSQRVKRFNCALNEGTGTTKAQVSFRAMYQRRIDWPLSTIPTTLTTLITAQHQHSVNLHDEFPDVVAPRSTSSSVSAFDRQHQQQQSHSPDLHLL